MAAAGANDAGEVVGLAHDYALLEKKDGDGFELWLVDLLANQLGKTVAAKLGVELAEVDGHEVCRVEVTPASIEGAHFPLMVGCGRWYRPARWRMRGRSGASMSTSRATSRATRARAWSRTR